MSNCVWKIKSRDNLSSPRDTKLRNRFGRRWAQYFVGMGACIELVYTNYRILHHHEKGYELTSSRRRSCTRWSKLTHDDFFPSSRFPFYIFLIDLLNSTLSSPNTSFLSPLDRRIIIPLRSPQASLERFLTPITPLDLVQRVRLDRDFVLYFRSGTKERSKTRWSRFRLPIFDGQGEFEGRMIEVSDQVG